MKFRNKLEEITPLLFCEINDNTRGFCLVLGIFMTLRKKYQEAFEKSSQQLKTVNYF